MKEQDLTHLTDETYGEIYNALKAQQNAAELLVKFRAALLSNEDPNDFKNRIERRQEIVALMGGHCPEMSDEIFTLCLERQKSFSDREDRIVMLIRKMMGINNNPKIIQLIRQLIMNPEKVPAWLQLNPLALLFEEVKRSFTPIVVQDKQTTPEQYLTGLLFRTTRRLSDLPSHIFQNIFDHLLSSMEQFVKDKLPDGGDYYRFSMLIKIRTFEALAHGNAIPITDAYYEKNTNTRLPFKDLKETVTRGNFLPTEKVMSLTFFGQLEPLFFAAKRGSQNYLDKCFKRYYPLQRKIYELRHLPYGGWVDNTTGRHYHDMGVIPMRDETQSEHQLRVIALGIKTFQLPEKFLKKIYNFDFISSQDIPLLLSAACNFGNRKILAPLITFLTQNIESYEWKSVNIERSSFYLIFPEHFETMLLFSAYEAKTTEFKNWLISLGAKPLALLDKAILLKDDEARKTLLIDMLDQFIQEKNPNGSHAQMLKDALQLDQHFNVPALSSNNSAGFFENASENAAVLRKLARLAKPFLEKHALINPRNLTQKLV